MPIIAVDLGNTRAKFGYFPDSDIPFPEPASTFVDLPGDLAGLIDWLESVSGDNKPIEWHIARTGSFLWDRIQRKLEVFRPDDVFKELSWRDVPIEPSVDFPEKVGIDRLLAAAAAKHWMSRPESRFHDQHRALVVDAGSAVTVDLISGEGKFSGGAILPGLNAVAESLAAISSKLPKISTDAISFAVYPGKNTEEALAAGIYWGAVGAVRQIYDIVRQSLDDTGLPSQIPIFLAGGDAKHLHNGLSLFVDPDILVILSDLVLSGIALTARAPSVPLSAE